MAQFVLVSSGITTAQLEKALEIKIRSGNLVSFVPQGASRAVDTSVVTGPMQSYSSNNNQEMLNSVRFEWDLRGVEFGAEIIKALAYAEAPAKKIA